jgi:hypothetical protein
VLLAFALLLAVTDGPSETDAAAQSRLGKRLCVNPDVSTKTCSSILSYKPGSDGFLIETGEVLVAPAQGITLEMTSLVKEEGGALCGAVQLTDMQKGIVRVNGTPLPAERNSAIVATLLERLAPMAGKKACEVLRMQGGQLTKFGQVEQVDLNLPGKPVKWIDPTEGFRVASSTQPS